MACVSALAVAGALGYALQTRNRAGSGQELLSTQNRPSAEGLAGLPKDYTGLPRQAPPLGPPLPGDLGRPILNAGAAPNTVTPATSPDPEAQRRAQEIEAARVSRMFAQAAEHRADRACRWSTWCGGNPRHHVSGRCRLCPEHAGSQNRLPHGLDRQTHDQPGSA
jgi:type IV secretory pathway VirB10-like protein